MYTSVVIMLKQSGNIIIKVIKLQLKIKGGRKKKEIGQTAGNRMEFPPPAQAALPGSDLYCPRPLTSIHTIASRGDSVTLYHHFALALTARFGLQHCHQPVTGAVHKVREGMVTTGIRI